MMKYNKYCEIPVINIDAHHIKIEKKQRNKRTMHRET
jgi:hypothetical protein